jgi:hypothetical protein
MTTFGDQVYQYGGMPVGGKMTTGNVFFVSSVRTNTLGATGTRPSSPFATLDAATNACTANNGDIVYIMPNHAENITGATTWAPDVAGVQYIGIGLGSDAPELSFNATSSAITASGANNLFQNIRFLASTSACVDGVIVGADHVTFDNCTWDWASTGDDFITMLNPASFDYTTVQNCRFIAETVVGGNDSAIEFKDSLNLVIKDCIFQGDFGTAAILSTDASVSTSIFISNNLIYNDDTGSTCGGIKITTACTGMIANNMIAHTSAVGADDNPIIDPGSCIQFENYCAKLVNTTGVVTMGAAVASSA